MLTSNSIYGAVWTGSTINSNIHFPIWLATKPNLSLCHAIIYTILVNCQVLFKLVEQLRAHSCQIQACSCQVSTKPCPGPGWPLTLKWENQLTAKAVNTSFNWTAWKWSISNTGYYCFSHNTGQWKQEASSLREGFSGTLPHCISPSRLLLDALSFDLTV